MEADVLRGDVISLRLTREADLDIPVERLSDLESRGNYFPITHYLSGYEISYQLFGSHHAGKGYTTEAVKLLVDYLFGRKKLNRLQLNIHPQNDSSKRVAQRMWLRFRERYA